MKIYLILFLVFSFAAPLLAAGRLEISLEKSEAEALAESARYQALAHEVRAAHGRAQSQKAQLWPKLSVEGSWRYVTEVPNLPLTGGRTIRFGDNESFTFGPQASWTLFDAGSVRRQWKSFQALERSKEEELKNARRQVVLAARLAYFQVMLSLEQARLFAESLSLAEAQYNDIENRRRGGISNRIDSLSAHQEVLTCQRQFRQAQTDLALSLRELFALTGGGGEADLSLPADYRTEKDLPEGAGKLSLFLKADGLETIRARIEPGVAANPDAGHPSLRQLEEAALASRLSARSAGSGHWPKIQITARTSLDRPNGPVIETFNQNSVGFTASIPLFEGGRVTEQAAELRQMAEAADQRKRGLLTDITRDWRKAGDQLAGLKDQRTINRKSVAETEELARLVYSSYKTGASNYIDVQTANVRALEAKVQAARTEVQILVQLAILNSLSH